MHARRSADTPALRPSPARGGRDAPEARTRRRAVAGVLLLLLSTSASLPSAAATPSTVITATATLQSIWIGEDLSCQVKHANDTAYQFYAPSTAPGDCGTFVVVGSTLYAPDFANHGTSATGGLGAYTPFTPVSQGAVSGAGTASSPYTIATTADAGTSGIQVQEVDLYVVGDDFYETRVTLVNRGGAPLSGLLYRAGDCFLGGSDSGYGAVAVTAPGSVACTQNPHNLPAGRVEEFIPLTAGSAYYHGGYSAIWSWIGGKTMFPDTCQCAFQIDNGAGLSWQWSLAPGGSATFVNRLRFDVPLPVTEGFTYAAGARIGDRFVVAGNDPGCGLGDAASSDPHDAAEAVAFVGAASPTRVALPDLPEPKFLAGDASRDLPGTHGTLVVAGGAADCSFLPSGSAYEFQGGSWRRLGDLNVPRIDPAAAAAGAVMYVAGGDGGDEALFRSPNDPRGMDPLSHAPWHTPTSTAEVLEGTSWSLLPDMPAGLVGAAGHVDPATGRFVVSGGHSHPQVPNSLVQEYDPVDGTWVGPHLDVPRASAVAERCDGTTVLVGGDLGTQGTLYGREQVTDSVEYDAAGAWVPGPQLPEPRMLLGGADRGTGVLVHGGYGLEDFRGAVPGVPAPRDDTYFIECRGGAPSLVAPAPTTLAEKVCNVPVPYLVAEHAMLTVRKPSLDVETEFTYSVGGVPFYDGLPDRLCDPSDCITASRTPGVPRLPFPVPRADWCCPSVYDDYDRFAPPSDTWRYCHQVCPDGPFAGMNTICDLNDELCPGGENRVLDAAAGVWRFMESLRQPRAQVGLAPVPASVLALGAGLPPAVLAVGGREANAAGDCYLPSDDVEVYHSVQGPPGEWTVLCPLPEGLIGPMVETVGTVVYVLGGDETGLDPANFHPPSLTAPMHYRPNRDIYALDLNLGLAHSNCWKKVGELPLGVMSAASVYDGGRIQVLGGHHHPYAETRAVQELVLPPMVLPRPPTASAGGVATDPEGSYAAVDGPVDAEVGWHLGWSQRPLPEARSHHAVVVCPGTGGALLLGGFLSGRLYAPAGAVFAADVHALRPGDDDWELVRNASLERAFVPWDDALAAGEAEGMTGTLPGDHRTVHPVAVPCDAWTPPEQCQSPPLACNDLPEAEEVDWDACTSSLGVPECTEEADWQVHDACDGKVSDGCADRPEPVQQAEACAGEAVLAAQRRTSALAPVC